MLLAMAVISAEWGFAGAVRPCGGQSILICTLSNTRTTTIYKYSVQRTICREWISLDNTEYNADEDLRLHTVMP